jgi:hypothetical protein
MTSYFPIACWMKSAVSLMGKPVNMSWCFSLEDFRFFSLSCTFDDMI